MPTFYRDNLLYGTYIELLKIIPTLHDLINKLGKESAAREIGRWVSGYLNIRRH
jgi:hypothetical protein